MTTDPFESATPSPWAVRPEKVVDQKPSQKVGTTFGRSEPPAAQKVSPRTAGKPPGQTSKVAVMPSSVRQPPHSPEAEQGVLGCLLFDADTCYDTCFTRIRSDEAFYDQRHKVIFETIRAVREDHKPVDLLNVVQRLREHGYLDAIGGIEYLDEMMESVVSTANIPSYIDTLLEKLMMRKVLETCHGMLDRLYDGGYNAREVAAGIEVDLATMSIALGGTKNGHLPKIVPVNDFVSVEIPHPPQLIEGVLHQGTKMVVGGGSKSFKTWILLDLALSVAYGKPWLRFPTSAGKVLFVNLEIQDAFFQSRLMEVAVAKGIKVNPSNIDVWNLRGHSAPYAQIVPKILDRIKEQSYSLIILDPIYKLYGTTDENSAGEVAQLLNTLERVCCETKAAVAFGAHFSKGNQSEKEAIDRIAGSGVFGRDPDSILSITRHEEEDCFTVEPILRNLKPITPFVVRWQFPLMQVDDTLDPDKLKKPGGRTKTATPEDLLSLLSGQNLTNEQWQSQALNTLDIGRSTFFKLKAELKAADRVFFSRIDDTWKIVDKQPPTQ